MPIENGVNWRPIDPDKRGRHDRIGDALDEAFKELNPNRSEFFDSLVDEWDVLFPKLPARPGRFEEGILFLYVKTAATRFVVRPRMKSIKETLLRRPGAPKKLAVKMEIHVQ